VTRGAGDPPSLTSAFIPFPPSLSFRLRVAPVFTPFQRGKLTRQVGAATRRGKPEPSRRAGRDTKRVFASIRVKHFASFRCAQLSTFNSLARRSMA